MEITLGGQQEFPRGYLSLDVLPWEASGDLISRYLPIALPWGSAIAERPIRVLIVISNPSDLEEKYGLSQADVMLEEEILEEALRKGYHVLHFLGHGAYNARRKQAVLSTQSDDGAAQRVSDDDLVNMLARQDVQPRLIVLVACQSAWRKLAKVTAALE